MLQGIPQPEVAGMAQGSDPGAVQQVWALPGMSIGCFMWTGKKL